MARAKSKILTPAEKRGMAKEVRDQIRILKANCKAEMKTIRDAERDYKAVEREASKQLRAWEREIAKKEKELDQLTPAKPSPTA